MRSFLLFLLNFAILSNCLANKSLRNRMARVALTLRNIKEYKERQRKLQEDTSQISEEETPIIPSATPYNSTGDNEPESGDANAQDTSVDANKPLSTIGSETGNIMASIQILKFHNFEVTRAVQINFGLILYFLNRPIANILIFRLRITYYYRLRLLQGGKANSVRTVCTLKDRTLEGKIEENGANADYNCRATASKDASNANITLNTDVNMKAFFSNGTEETIEFKEVNFNGNSSQEAKNIQYNLDDIDFSFQLINGMIIDDGDRYTLRIKGLVRNPKFDNNEAINMTLTNVVKKENIMELYECKINKTDPDDFIINCDTSKHSITTSNNALHLNCGVNKETRKFISLSMLDYNNTDKIQRFTLSNSFKYMKNSSGLSGGSIAAIVITCVVALLGISIAYIMNKKPKTPSDNTTILGFNTTDNE